MILIPNPCCLACHFKCLSVHADHVNALCKIAQVDLVALVDRPYAQALYIINIYRGRTDKSCNPVDAVARYLQFESVRRGVHIDDAGPMFAQEVISSRSRFTVNLFLAAARTGLVYRNIDLEREVLAFLFQHLDIFSDLETIKVSAS